MRLMVGNWDMSTLNLQTCQYIRIGDMYIAIHCDTEDSIAMRIAI